MEDYLQKLVVLIVGLISSFPLLYAEEENVRDAYADSLMHQVFQRSGLYESYIVEYNAHAYIKGTTRVLDKNILFRFAPDFFYLDKKNDNTIVETITNIHFHAPNHFTQKILAINGTSMNEDDLYQKSMQFLNINVYNPTSFNNEVLMPTTKAGFKYYRFFFESELDTLGHHFLKIRVEPQIKSQKLVSGYIYVLKDFWTIARIDLKGNWDFMGFHVRTNFGLPEENFLVPLETEVDIRMKLLGNEVVNRYYSHYNYTFINRYKSDAERKESSRKFDLSDYFDVKVDSLPVIKDSLFWVRNRPIPLTEDESLIYERSSGKLIDTAIVKSKNWNFAKGIFTSRRFEYNSTQFRYSGLLNPFKLAFSRSNGITYWQQLRLNREFNSGQAVNFSPNIGFVFRQKEIFFNTPLRYLFAPGRFGQLEFSLANTNQSFNSKIIEEINGMIPDSIDFEDLNLEYYRHYYSTLNGQYELFNGFISRLGVEYHLYDPVKSGDFTFKDYSEEKISDLLYTKYKSFAPTIGFQWTHRQYYRMNLKRKEYVGSYCPTFSFEYARGINGILDSNSDYERIEADIQQSIQLGLLRSIQYYAGAGIFTNTKSVYFADFKKFRKRNFPESWEDHIGGVFQLLDSYWYNASDLYVQAHIMYESPFMFLQLFKNVTKDIFKERFYVSQLYAPALPCYTELGYGIGNFIFNAGAFVSLTKGRYDAFGFKLAFELGR